MLVYGDMRFRVIRRLELARCRLLQWNWHKIGDIFRHIKDVETNITKLQYKKDQEGDLQEFELRTLHHRLFVHHSLLRQ